MQKTYFFAALCILIPYNSNAQTSSTQCYRVGSTMQCNTYTTPIYQAPQPVVPQTSMRDLLGQSGNATDALQRGQQQALQNQLLQRQIEQNRLAHEAQEREYSNQLAEQNRSDGIRKTISILLKNNDCEAALRYSLDAGDVGLAAQVKQFCAKP